MKRINIIILATLILSLSGCKDFLDTRVDVYDTMDRLETRYSTLNYFANAYYVQMQYGFNVIDNNLFAAASDEAEQTAPTSQVSYFNRGLISPDINPIGYLYQRYYEGIRAARFFLDYAKDGEDFLALNRDTSTVYNPDGSIYSTDRPRAYMRDVINLNWQRAEAAIAEAYYYSELIKMYGAVPLVENFDGERLHLERAEYDDVVDHIVTLIDENVDKVNLDWRVALDPTEENAVADVTNWNFRDNIGRFDKTTALAIKARTLLYAASPRNNPDGDIKKWEAAAAAAHEVIETRKAVFAKGFGFGDGAKTYPNPSLSPNRDYEAYFRDNTPAKDNESIFVIRKAASSWIEANNYPIGTRGGNSGVCPTQNLVDDYELIAEATPNPYENLDPRFYATIVYNGSIWNGKEIDQSPKGAYSQNTNGASKTGYYLRKFLAPNLNLIEGGTKDHVWPVYRYAEVLLNYAEAMNEAYGPDNDPKGYGMTARDALMEVRNAASTSLPTVTATSKADFRKAIKHERRIELAFEDHRYWDLIRWLDAETVLNKPIKGVKVGRNNLGGYTYSYRVVAERVFEERNYYLPFSRKEISNSNGTIQQNPEYN